MVIPNRECPKRGRKPSEFDGLLSQVYSPCPDMPDALQGLLDLIALREQAVIDAPTIEQGNAHTA